MPSAVANWPAKASAANTDGGVSKIKVFVLLTLAKDTSTASAAVVGNKDTSLRNMAHDRAVNKVKQALVLNTSFAQAARNAAPAKTNIATFFYS